MNRHDLLAVTGLSSEELAEVLESNPRAYMAVRGAVAEKHLEKELQVLIEEGVIDDVRTASSDLDKDFYLQINGSELSMECKNVEVIKSGTKRLLAGYLSFLADEGMIDARDFNGVGLAELSLKELKEKLSTIPQTFRESGMAKYEYSASLVDTPNLGGLNDFDFVAQFESNPLSIDFQRTRNSTDSDGDTKRQRFYKHDEIDLVGACLFSRTLEWKFLYARASNFDRHKTYEDRYSNKLVLKPGVWTSNLRTLLTGR